MRRAPTRRTALFAAAVFAAAGVLASFAVVVARGWSTPPLEWLVPLVAGALISAITLLLAEDGPGETEEGEQDLAQAECAACGSQILEEWRLCPHCGSLLECDTHTPLDGGAVGFRNL